MNLAQEILSELIRVTVEQDDYYPYINVKITLPEWGPRGEDYHFGIRVSEKQVNKNEIIVAAKSILMKTILGGGESLQRAEAKIYQLTRLLRKIASPIECRDPEVIRMLEVGE